MITVTPGSTRITDPNNVILELDQLVKSIPITDTFHYLGHLGKVFIHSDRHAILSGNNLDVLIRMPAGSPNRQCHLRWSYTGGSSGTLDIDVILYKDPTVSADGTPADAISTNAANVKTTGVLLFEQPTVTDIGEFWTHGMIIGEKRTASSKEQAVPEYILAPDGSGARDYLLRAHVNGNNSDITPAVFFYDSEAT